ncbi:hypothetical protein Vadar_018185 [Vaccinium darrowii]|uniref:Uncharacterized protein n=1 Tax=Vaccinium darrowii TaxID=229202 RepID=A0ACB7YYK8_9ERIC|nr:hypothetical protein Vadar_018185 [Vaccinium darrowii]
MDLPPAMNDSEHGPVKCEDEQPPPPDNSLSSLVSRCFSLLVWPDLVSGGALSSSHLCRRCSLSQAAKELEVEGVFVLTIEALGGSVGIPWFRKFFSNFGFVVDTHLTVKKSRRTGNRFGFIRFENKRAVDIAIAKANGLWIGRRRLMVERAAYDRGFVTPKTASNFRESGKGFQKLAYPSDLGVSKYGYQNKSFDNDPIQPDRFHSLEQPGKSMENIFSIYVQPIASEWLTRSIVVRLFNLSATELVQKAFTDLNFNDVLVRHLGGLDMIITFQSKDDRVLALNNSAVTSWFKSIKPWNGEVAGKSRLVWLKCRGIPLTAWGTQTFRRIGEIWGDFIILDEETMKEESFDVGRLLIAADRAQRIDECINISIRGKNHRVNVWEEDCEDFLNEKVNRDWVSKHIPDKLIQSKPVEPVQNTLCDKEQFCQLEKVDVGDVVLVNAVVDPLKNVDVGPIENAEVPSKCEDLNGEKENMVVERNENALLIDGGSSIVKTPKPVNNHLETILEDEDESFVGETPVTNTNNQEEILKNPVLHYTKHNKKEDYGPCHIEVNKGSFGSKVLTAKQKRDKLRKEIRDICDSLDEGAQVGEVWEDSSEHSESINSEDILRRNNIIIKGFEDAVKAVGCSICADPWSIAAADEAMFGCV